MSEQLTRLELIQEMRLKGTEIQLDGTDRLIRLRPLDAPALLREGKMPDILTPLIIRMTYQELSDSTVREFLGQPKESAADALSLLETMEYVVSHSIADGTKVEDLTLGEKRWIFRLAMQPAELLINFRYDEDADIPVVDEGEDLSPVAEPDYAGAG